MLFICGHILGHDGVVSLKGVRAVREGLPVRVDAFLAGGCGLLDIARLGL